MFPRRTLLTLPETAGYPNGQIPSSALTATYQRPDRTYGQLAKTPARCFRAMQGQCQKDTGVWISFTGNPYRSYQAQVDLLKSRAEPFSPGIGNYTWVRHWDGNGDGIKETWYGNGAQVAVPGESNHGWAKAVDTALLNSSGSPTIGITANSKVWYWLLAHATEFGFCWESDKEPWHVTYYMGGAIPQAVIDYEGGKKPDPFPKPDPVNHRTSPEEVHMLLFIWRPHINDAPPPHTPDDGGFAWFCQWSTGLITHADQAVVKWAGALNPPIVAQVVACSWAEYQRDLAIAHGNPVPA